MDRMLYVSMSGARQLELRQAVVTHNLANANTTGFRADLAAMRNMPVYGPGLPSRAYAMTERPGIDLSSGSAITTGRELDIAVDGQGFVAVQGRDGSEAYTRAGDLRVTGEGLLVTGAGYPVLGDDGPIAVPPAARVIIGTDGTVSVQPIGQDATTLTEVGRIKLVSPEVSMLAKSADGLIRLKGEPGQVAPADASVRVISGTLESSNVNAIDAMVEMISLARQFEMQIKAMKTAEEVDAASAQLMRMG